MCIASASWYSTALWEVSFRTKECHTSVLKIIALPYYFLVEKQSILSCNWFLAGKYESSKIILLVWSRVWRISSWYIYFIFKRNRHLENYQYSAQVKRCVYVSPLLLFSEYPEVFYGKKFWIFVTIYQQHSSLNQVVFKLFFAKYRSTWV